jgi:hypothetical protein
MNYESIYIYTFIYLYYKLSPQKKIWKSSQFLCQKMVNLRNILGIGWKAIGNLMGTHWDRNHHFIKNFKDWKGIIIIKKSSWKGIIIIIIIPFPTILRHFLTHRVRWGLRMGSSQTCFLHKHLLWFLNMCPPKEGGGIHTHLKNFGYKTCKINIDMHLQNV